MGVTQQAVASLTHVGSGRGRGDCGNGPDRADHGHRADARRQADAILVADSIAGMPELVDMRAVYRAEPATMAAAAGSMRDAGASIIGGCCGTTPTTSARSPPGSPAQPRAGPAGPSAPVSEWIYFIHPPRDDFAATMTGEERAVWNVHFERFERMHDGVAHARRSDPRLGQYRDRDLRGSGRGRGAQDAMDEDPVIAGGYARGELRPFRVSLLRGRDHDAGQVGS